MMAKTAMVRFALLLPALVACGPAILKADADVGAADTAVADTAAADTAAADTAAADLGVADLGVDRGSTADGGARSAGCGATGRPKGDFHRTTKDGAGKARDYEVLVPDSYDPNTPLALTFGFHGAGGTAEGSRGYDLQGTAGGASIFAFPQGISFQNFGVGWDDSCGGYDVKLFDAMVSELQADYCIDPNRLFAAGFSWGGDFVTALACCRGDRVRAVGAASCTDEYTDPKDPTTYANLPCPVKSRTAIRFTHDASGGDSGYPAPLFTTTSALYRSFTGCASTSTPTSPGPCVAFQGCSTALVECSYPGLGHSIPQGWGRDTWSFFASFK